MTTKSTIRVTLNGSNAEIEFVRADGSVEFHYNDYDTSNALRAAIYAYGLKQILADAGAVGRGTDDETRLNKMEKRAQSLRDGTWAFRDGFGTPKADAAYRTQFACMVEAGLVPNDAAACAAWSSATKAERATIWASATMAAARALFDTRQSKPRADVADLLARLGIAAD